MLEKRVAVAVEDRKTFNAALLIIMLLALAVMIIGFWIWQTEVQPKQDRLLDIQIRKAEQDLKASGRKPFRGPTS